MARIPTAGPSASSAKATCQPAPSLGASAPTMTIVTPVRMNPSAVWIGERRTGRARRRQLGDRGRELRRVGDDRHAPDDAEHERQPRRRTEQEPIASALAPLQAIATIVTVVRPARSATRPAATHPSAAGGDHQERTEAGQRRVLQAAGREARRDEQRDPRPHRIELPHVPEVAEVGQAHGAVAEGPRRVATLNRGALTSFGPSRTPDERDEPAGDRRQARAADHDTRQSAPLIAPSARNR